MCRTAHRLLLPQDKGESEWFFVVSIWECLVRDSKKIQLALIYKYMDLFLLSIFIKTKTYSPNCAKKSSPAFSK